MFRPITKLATAVVVAGVVAFALSAALAATGHAVTQPPQPLAKASPHVAVKGTACSRHGWPNFEPKCQFDLRESAGKARAVRVLAVR